MDYSGTVAIVGIGGIFPDAPNPEALWDNIRNVRSSAREVQAGRWRIAAETAYSQEQGAPDHVYSKRGCFIDSIPLIEEMPGLSRDEARLLDPLFHLAVNAGRMAFNDAVTSQLDRSRIGVIIGNLALPSETSSNLAANWLGRTFAEKLTGQTFAPVPTLPLNRYVAGLPAGLLAHSLGLGGPVNTLDAACASSLYAIKLAIDELLSGRADAMLTGGLSRPDPLYTQMGFSQLRALSKRGICSPFDASGDGLVVGEGCGIFLLKRTTDAIAQGDRIHGIIRGIGLSNDIGGSLLAPMSEGQLRAMRSAYRQAGWQPSDVELIECHATGTPVGDAVEVASLRELWGDDLPHGERCVIGSVKSNIGHLLTAAGSAALTKVLLAMRAKTLPPTANFNSPQPGMGLENSPFRVLTTETPWQRRDNVTPRRAAVSAFGFGGINAHLLVEEWLPETGAAFSLAAPQQPESDPIAIVGLDASFGPWQTLRSFQERVLGGDAGEQPARLANWWGAEQSSWFSEEPDGLENIAGFGVDRVEVEANRFRIPPKEMEEMLPQQLLMLRTAANAMQDAGISQGDNCATGVLIGIALDLNSTNFSLRWSLAEQAREYARQIGRKLNDEELSAWTGELREAIGPHLSANRTMGALGSVVASRIAREFKVGGPSFTISSEESSGLRALETAVRMLRQNELDRAVVGAVDLAGDLRAVLGQQSKTPFSVSGRCRPFDAAADGTLIGEGAAALVLKRLTDAQLDGDKVYAVIRGVGSACGAPDEPAGNPLLQAMERAYGDAGIEPASVSYLEAAACGSSVLDRMEADTMAAFFRQAGAPERSCAVSSVKGDIGHSGAASGMASLVRACLALHQEIIPACRNTENPHETLTNDSPLFVPTASRYWLTDRANGPRRAGVTAIGVDGSCSHVVLEQFEKQRRFSEIEFSAPLGECAEQLIPLAGSDHAELSAELTRLQRECRASDGSNLARLAASQRNRYSSAPGKPLAMAMVARNHDELEALLQQGHEALQNNGRISDTIPALRDRLFHSPEPLGPDAPVAFVFPGSGNHFSGMGLDISSRWPLLFRRQERENLYLASQFQPELFWNGAAASRIDDDHRAVIFGQVATGTIFSDLISSFGITPSAVIGYSLGESAGLFSQRAWVDRDAMYTRMKESTLFTHDLAGECRAARAAWNLPLHEAVNWSLGVVDAPENEVRSAMAGVARVYLLIVNTPDECVIGGDSVAVQQLVSRLRCNFFPLKGVTTVHCEVALPVAQPYHDLHLFPTTPPEGVTFYSGAWGRSYELTRESAADAILAQALEGIDYPAVIETAYADGARLFLEMGPGASCSRMIGRILGERPHLARSACWQGQDQYSTVLRMVAALIAERKPVDLTPLDDVPPSEPVAVSSKNKITVKTGGAPFAPPLPPHSPAVGEQLQPPVQDAAKPPQPSDSSESDSLLQEFARAQQAQLEAHSAFLSFSDTIAASMAQAISLEMTLRQTMGDEALSVTEPTESAGATRRVAQAGEAAPPHCAAAQCAFDRAMCLEFATGSVARMLGPEFSEVDSFPTRVRLPDEPLMLVDRIMAVEGEPRSMTSGRVITEHDIHPGAWYLDGGRIPTCIAVEAGQADLFLSGYLGIDFITRGLAVYRLLDAVVTFHRGLPGPGETIHYDIRIERFFRQGDTWLFRFFFEATVDGQPLLSMRDGCAGFFSAEALAAGKGIVRPAIDPRPTSGIRPDDWRDLVLMGRESYDAGQLDSLRNGDLAACFGPLFANLSIRRPLTIPGGAMRMVHRVTDLEPGGGRYGLGAIRAEADIRPDDWFLTCHFVDDRVMPGTLMYECCMHTLRILLLRMGWVAEADDAVWEPVPGVASKLCCRGQMLETTKVVTYEVTLREVGYRPEPYVVCDALMYADGKPIVEISSMSCRLSGTTREKLERMWELCATDRTDLHSKGFVKPAIYSKEQILAYSNGKPSEGFGDRYRIFDSGRKIARLPGPPFQFMDRVTAVGGEPWQMKGGAMAEAQYDIPVDAWYFGVERQGRMPFSVLLEAALQPCGWLAAYVGSALTSPVDISFRNLGGTAVQHRPVTPESGTITATATMKKVATSGGMIIQEFDFSVADQHGVIYEGETMFGFFSREALANQVGIRDAQPYQPTAAEVSRGTSLPYPTEAPFPDKMLRMIDTIELYVAEGGPQGLGYIRGSKAVDPDEWFFKAHFFEDPVTPGSLGLESFLQLVKFAAVERWGCQPGSRLAAVALERRHRWLYRGQIVPANSLVTVEAWITAVDEEQRIMTAAGFLAVDGKLIYQMNDFTVRMEY